MPLLSAWGRAKPLVTLVALALALASPADAAAAPARPNVVVIYTDDQTLESMKVMTHTRRLLALQGTTFDNSFVSLSECCPSRAAFLTGQYAHNNGVQANHAPHGGYYKLDNTNTLAVWLRRAGYFTAHAGKYLNEYGKRSLTEVPPGWTEWYGRVGDSSYWDYQVNHNRRVIRFGHAPRDYSTDVITRFATGLIRRRARSPQPFFLWAAYEAPHGAAPDERRKYFNDVDAPIPAPRHLGRYRSAPLPRPAAFNEADVSDKPDFIKEKATLTAEQIPAVTRGYRHQLESLLAVDEGVRSIVSTLRQVGELGRTLIIFTSDNGFLFGEHRIPDGKLLPYEPSIRVPLIMRGPGVPRNQHRRQLVANIDLAPTIVAVARARAGRLMDGVSLLGYLRNARLASARAILIESPPEVKSKLQRFTGIRTATHMYAEYEDGDRELYDLRRDPQELSNQASNGAMAAIANSLKRRLAALRNCRGAACRGG